MKRLITFITKIPAMLEFFIFYLKEVLISNFRVAYDVLTPTHLMRPALIKVSVAGMTDRQLLAAGNLISMTPGTLSVDISEDRTELKIHVMYAENPSAVEQEIENQYLRRIKHVF